MHQYACFHKPFARSLQVVLILRPKAKNQMFFPRENLEEVIILKHTTQKDLFHCCCLWKWHN